MGASLECILRYQDLLLKELERLRRREQPIGIPCDDVRRSSDPVVSKLIREEWLVKVNFDDECRYVTRHGLLINTLLNLRWVTLYHSGPRVEKVLPGERQVIDYDIEWEEEIIFLPTESLDKGELRSWITQICPLRSFNVNVSKLVEVVRKTLKFAWYSTNREKVEVKITPFQKRVIEEYVDVVKSLDKKALVITAPTGTGKTKIIQVLSLVHLLNNDIVILIYPRKSLAKQELKDFLKIIYWLNRELYEGDLKQCGVEGYFVAIDDGDTPRSKTIREQLSESSTRQVSFRGLECPICGKGELIYVEDKDTHKILVKCSNRKCDFNKYVSKYLLATKDQIKQFSLNLKGISKGVPLIYITNIQCLYRRILNPDYWPLLERASIMFLDEAHVYSYYFGGHVHYVLKELRYINPRIKFVLASATLTNPLDFASELLGLEESKIKLVNYEEVKESIKEGRKPTENTIRKLVVRIYVLPHPEVAVDTVVENFAVLTHLWCLRYDHQGIVFIDNKNTIERLYRYITEIIYVRRRLIEIKGLLQYKLIPEQVVPQSILEANAETHSIDLEIRKLRDSLGVTYSGYEQRNYTERKFLTGELKLLFSTSTIELGINISNVAVILQHSFPISPESFIQRVGRAGRTGETMYVSLGIMVLPHSMLGVRYVHDRAFREEMHRVLQKVGKDSYAIMFQHLISTLVMKILEQKVYKRSM